MSGQPNYDDIGELFRRRAEILERNPRTFFQSNAEKMFDTALVSGLRRAAQKCLGRFTPEKYDRRDFQIECVQELTTEIKLRMQETPHDGARQKLFMPVLAAMNSDAVKADPKNAMVLAKAVLDTLALWERTPPAPAPEAFS